jgi:integrase
VEDPRENPVRLARTGKRRLVRRREIEPFTREEIDRVAAELGSLYGPMIVFAAETGLRSGELAALAWRDVDRDAAVVFIRRVVALGRVKEPKTERSRRRVPLTARAIIVLDSLPRRIDTRLVFPSPRGGSVDMHNFARRGLASGARGGRPPAPSRLRPPPHLGVDRARRRDLPL